jgi:hypothetical protein
VSPLSVARPPVGGHADVERLHGVANWLGASKARAHLLPARRVYDRCMERPYKSRPQAHDDGDLGIYPLETVEVMR